MNLLRGVTRPIGYLIVIPVILFLGLWIAYLNCAHKVAPGGGPEDKTPPEVIWFFPPRDSVGLNALEYIELEFGEAVRQTNFASSFWIMPEVPGEFKVKWKGNRRVRIHLPAALDADQTYLFTLGTDIMDLRNNRLASPFKIAFSTGLTLDNGSISGSVFSDKPERDVFIYAYRLGADMPMDSLLNQRPRYYTQIDERGDFNLNYLSMGDYRLVALLDRDFNRKYTPGSDFIGIPFTDIRLDSSLSHFANLNFYLIQEDTVPPYIQRVDTLSTREVVVQWNEPIRLDTPPFIRVQDTLSGDDIPVYTSSFNRDEPSQLRLFFRQIPPRRPVRLTVEGILDLAGNSPRPSGMIRSFTTAARVDTTSPRFLNMIPGPRSVRIPFDVKLELNFNLPVDSARLRKYFRLRDGQEKPVEGRFDLLNARRPVFQPSQPLGSLTTYHAELRLDSLRDVWDRPFPDTVITVEFTTVDVGELGEIAGVVRVSHPEWRHAMVEAIPLRGKELYQTRVAIHQVYQLDHLPDGPYLLKAIIDVNENRKWDRGSTFPWTFSEPFLYKPDTVKVRKRWMTQGIDFYFNN